MSIVEEDIIKDLREKNSQLALDVQHWKLLAAQREKEKIELMKDVNELRLKLSRLRSGGAAEARQLDAALQSASEEALSHLVQASGAVARSIELTKQYTLKRQELDTVSPRWSNLSGTPSSEKVHRVPPTLIAGQPIQPVVSLTRTFLDFSTRARSPNVNVTERAVPMHLLQDVYIPLTRIDTAEFQVNNIDSDADNSVDESNLDESNNDEGDEPQSGSEDNVSQRLEVVLEDVELEENSEHRSSRSSHDNPLEGPSWMLDESADHSHTVQPTSLRVSTDDQPSAGASHSLEPDSTTHGEPGGSASLLAADTRPTDEAEKENVFTPTVRRRKRSATSPAAPATPASATPTPTPATASASASASTSLRTSDRYSPRPTHRGSQFCNRELKVLVAKMCLKEDPRAGGDVSPPKRAALQPATPGRSNCPPEATEGLLAMSPTLPVRFDAPSPNGATDSGVIVSDSTGRPPSDALRRRVKLERLGRRSCDERRLSHEAHTARRLSQELSEARRLSREAHDARRLSQEARERLSQEESRQTQARQTSKYSQPSQTERDSTDSDSSLGQAEGRSRRPRKNVTYKEKALNRKLRR